MDYKTYQVLTAMTICVPLWCKCVPNHHRKCFTASTAEQQEQQNVYPKGLIDYMSK